MTWSFDPRFTDCDDPTTFEAWLIRSSRPDPPAMLTERQAAHLERIAEKATQDAIRNCLDCQLPLAIGARTFRCLTCYAKRERVLKQASRSRQKIRRTTASERAKASGWAHPRGTSYGYEP